MQQKQTILNLILLEYQISILKKVRHGLVIFSRTQIKSVYIETFAENLIL